ncbi:hypothetical protein ACFV84_37935, partial [Kitasatospora sp. NPDC059811]
MVTYAQAQELAEEWINGGVPQPQQREVRVREFDLGFVCWAVAPGDGPAGPSGAGDGSAGEARLVIARDSGATTLWPALPVNEVVRQYEEAYGRPVAANPAGAAKPAPGPVEATSFLLSPPQWLQEAGAAAIAAEAERLGGQVAPAPAAPVAPAVPVAEPVAAAPAVPPVPAVPSGSAGPAGFAVPPQAPAPVPVPPVGAEAATVLMPEGLRTTGSDLPDAPAPAGAEAATMLMPPEGGYGMPPVPPPAAQAPVPPAAVEPAPTLLASPDAVPGLMGLPGAPSGPPGGVEQPPTVLAPPAAAPQPVAPPAAAAPVEHAPTMLAAPGGLPGPGGPPAAPAPAPAPQAGLGRNPGSAPPPPPPAALRGGASAPGAHGVALGRNPGSAPPPPPPAGLRLSL